MTLTTMFDYQEQEAIRKEVRDVKASYLRDHIPITRRHHFTMIADRHKLAYRIMDQLEAYENGEISDDEITFNVEIAELFDVDRTNVAKYLQKRISILTYKTRELLCRRISGKRGGRNGSSKGSKFKRKGKRGKKVEDKKTNRIN